MKLGLVLEGGAMRGLFTAGVSRTERNPEKLCAAYQAGYDLAKKEMAKIKEFIK